MEKVKERTGIYHEHQIGLLCGQHALNNLIQEPFFSPDTLADIARQLDVEEISVLAHTPFQSENMDDTGFFNIQVLQRALAVFEIELIPYASQDVIAQQARSNPESIEAYICNLGQHWFTIRRFGRQYFNLNSFYYVPELHPEMMLGSCLSFIQGNGYSVFIVNGGLPSCLADQQLKTNPIGQGEYNLLTKDLPKLIMDENMLGNFKNGNKNGGPVLTVSRSLYEELRKNPNDPEIRRKFNSILPAGITIDDIPEFSGISKHKTGELMVTSCNCPHHRHRPQPSTDSLAPLMMRDPFIDNPNKLQQSRMITGYVTEYIYEESNLNNQNEPHQQRQGSTRLIIMSRSSNRNNTSAAEHRIQQLKEKIAKFEKEEEEFIQQALTHPMLGATGMIDDEDYMHHEATIEEFNEQALNQAIADSLISSGSATNQSGETPEVIPLPKTNSAPISTKQTSAPLTDTNSSFLQNTDSLSSNDVHSTTPKDTNSSTPSLSKNTSLPSSQNVNSTLSKDTNSSSIEDTSSSPTTLYASPSTDAHSLPSTIVDSEYIRAPSIEELRQRRLRNYGNRDRSIISQASNFDD